MAVRFYGSSYKINIGVQGLLYTVVPPNTAPPLTASHPFSSPGEKKLYGKVYGKSLWKKFLFCQYVAARVWGTDQIEILARGRPIPPISEYRRFFVSPVIGVLGVGDCSIIII